MEAQELLIIGAAFIIVTVGVFGLVRLLSRDGSSRGIVLQTRLDYDEQAHRTGEATDGDPSATPTQAQQRRSLKGARGIALSDLRPGGFAEIANRRVDVVSEGDYIREGDLIEVISDEGYRRVVRRVRPAEGEGGQTAPTGRQRERLRRLG